MTHDKCISLHINLDSILVCFSSVVLWSLKFCVNVVKHSLAFLNLFDEQKFRSALFCAVVTCSRFCTYLVKCWAIFKLKPKLAVAAFAWLLT